MLTQQQILLARYFREVGLKPEFEYEFAKPRKFRFDVCDVGLMVAAEANGGQWSRFGHRSWGKQAESSNDKHNAAQGLGWTVFQWTNSEIEQGKPLEVLKQWMGA